MKKRSIGFTGLILAVLVAAACSSGISETEQKANVGSAAKGCVQAQFDQEAEKWINCIHPKILESQPGGKEKMLKDLKEIYAMTGNKKMPYDSMNFEQPKEIKTLGKHKAAVVAYQVSDKDFENKPRTTKGFLLGVSEDEGKTWKFANSSPESIKELDKVVPGVSSMEMPKVEY